MHGLIKPGGALLLSAFISHSAIAATQLTSLSNTGEASNMPSMSPSLSGDGNLVAFESLSTNLVDNDVNMYAADVFVYNRSSATIELISVNNNGEQANSYSGGPTITPDGRYVAFHSPANNLAPADTNPWSNDIFIRDRQTNTTILVSKDSLGGQQFGDSLNPAVSNNAAVIAFETMSPLDAGDTNNDWDIYVRDRSTGITTRITTAFGGGDRNGRSINTNISGDGRYVTFESLATNLVNESVAPTWHIYLHDRDTRITTMINRGVYSDISNNGCCIVYRALNTSTFTQDIFHYTISTRNSVVASQSSDGAAADQNSLEAGISGDGQRVIFNSAATTLVAGDLNGHVDTFVRDIPNNTTIRVNSNTLGGDANNASLSVPSLDTTGDRAAFASMATNLVADNINGMTDIFVAPLYHGAATDVLWRDLVYAQVVDGTLSKSAAHIYWDGGATSLQVLPGDGGFEYTIADYGYINHVVVGLSYGNTNNDWTDIDYSNIYRREHASKSLRSRHINGACRPTSAGRPHINRA